MRRARQQLVATAAALVTSLVTGSALAYHAGNLFDVPPGGGGGGGLFYTGSPREHGWTCAACHIEAPGRSRVNVSSDPPDLITAGSYAPAQTYRLSFALTNEYLGLGSPHSNYNSALARACGRLPGSARLRLRGRPRRPARGRAPGRLAPERAGARLPAAAVLARSPVRVYDRCCGAAA
jgi:hypothetical protein